MTWKQKLWHKIVERDEELCVRCGSVAIDVHHIIPKSKAKKNSRKVWREENMVCLCYGCHMKGQWKTTRLELLTLMRDTYGYDMEWTEEFGWGI